MEPWERIEKVIEYLKLNKSSFSKEIGLSNNVTISRIIREKRRPSKKVLMLIASRFPFIRYNWLLTGEGEMLTGKSDNPVTDEKPYTGNFLPSSGEKLFREVQYDSLVDALKVLVESNRELVETNRKLVQMLGDRMGK